MPKISLWKPRKDSDYHFNDRALKEYMNMGGTGVYLHKYIGPVKGGKETKIDDVLFMENRSRKYSDDVYEMRGTYMPNTTEFQLTQFAYLAQDGTINIMFHYNEMLNILGRKIMSGDVLELPHLDDPDTLDPDAAVTHRFYSVQDAVHAKEGYGVKWYSHMWQVKAKQIIASPEFANIKSAADLDNKYDLDINSDLPSYLRVGTIINSDGEVVKELCCDDPLSSDKIDQEITDAIIDEAYSYVRFDPKQFDAAHIWVFKDDKDRYVVFPWSGDAIPPNGEPLSGMGDEFPENAADGDFYVRTDFDTPRLFVKRGNVWKLIEHDMRKIWTAYNKKLDRFIDNRSTDVMTDGTTVKTKKAISKVVKPKANIHKSKEDQIIEDNGGKKQ